MRRLLTGIAALALGLAILPALADDKKDPAPDAKKDDATNSEKTIKAGAVVGKVVEVNETAKSLKVEVTIQYTKPNIGEIQALEQAQINYARAVANRDVNGALMRSGTWPITPPAPSPSKKRLRTWTSPASTTSRSV